MLPPRGIFIPTRMIFHPQLSAAVILTWIQLRCLAWDGWSTPPLSVPELASLLAIHPARLSRHLSTLQDISALSWRTMKHGKVILSFPEEPSVITENHIDAQNLAGSALLSSVDREVPGSQSYFPRQIMGYLSNQDDQDEFSRINDSADSKYLKNVVERCFINS
jgi:hypothetical protein